MITIEYGAMSSKFSIEAESKLTAYCAICVQYQNNAFAVVIYSPDECKEDQWASFDGKISARLDEVFGGDDAFDKYFDDHIDEIKKAYNTIKRII